MSALGALKCNFKASNFLQNLHSMVDCFIRLEKTLFQSKFSFQKMHGLFR